MRIAAIALLPLLAVPAAADLAQDAFQWAADIIDGNSAPAPKSDDVHIMDGWKWSDCGLPSDAITIDKIELSPDPPKPGKNLTVTVHGTANEKIEEGAYADVTVKLGLIKLIQKRFDVCEEARNANASIQCPIEKGQYTVVQEVALPKEIPQAKFVVNVRGYTTDDDDMVCLDLVVDFMNPDKFW